MVTMTYLKHLLILLSIFGLTMQFSCISIKTVVAPSANPDGPRTLILNDLSVPEDVVGKFTCWYCTDYIKEDQILVEVGYYLSDSPRLPYFGFIL